MFLIFLILDGELIQRCLFVLLETCEHCCVNLSNSAFEGAWLKKRKIVGWNT